MPKSYWESGTILTMFFFALLIAGLCLLAYHYSVVSLRMK